MKMKKARILFTVIFAMVCVTFSVLSVNAQELTKVPTGALSVKDFGAVGDGVTDDTVAFVTALTTANGKELYIPAGTYVVNGGVVTDGIDINIIGIGKPMIQLVTQKSNTRCMDLRNAQSIKVTGVAFDAYREVYGEQGNIACMYIFDSNNININNCRFQNCFKEGITLASAKPVGNNLLENISITNNTFYNTSDNVWVKCRVKNFTFSGNSSELSIGTGVEFVSGEVAEDVVISNNYFKNFRNGNAIKLLDCKNVKITGNQMENCIFGIRVFVSEHLVDGVPACENVLISENVFNDGESGKTCTPIVFLTPTAFDESRYLYDNIEISFNEFSTTNGITVAYVENLYLYGNKSDIKGDSFPYVFHRCDNVYMTDELVRSVKKTMCRTFKTNNVYMDNVDYTCESLFYVQGSKLNIYVTNMRGNFNA